MGRAAYKGFRRRRGAARLVLSSSFSPSLSLRVVSVCVWVAAVGFGWGLGGACSCAVGLGRFGVGPVRALRVVIVMGLFFSFLPFPFFHTPSPRHTRRRRPPLRRRRRVPVGGSAFACPLHVGSAREVSRFVSFPSARRSPAATEFFLSTGNTRTQQYVLTYGPRPTGSHNPTEIPTRQLIRFV